MGKNKTELLEIAHKILDKIPGNTIIAEEMTKSDLIEWIKVHTANTSAPDPESSPIDTTKTPSVGQTVKPEEPKSSGKKPMIGNCDGCGLCTADKYKSCPTEGCKGTLKYQEVE